MPDTPVTVAVAADRAAYATGETAIIPTHVRADSNGHSVLSALDVVL